MLAQKLFGCPAVMVVFGCQMQNLVSSGTDSRRPGGIDHQMRIVSPRAHDFSFNQGFGRNRQSCDGSQCHNHTQATSYLTLKGKSVEFRSSNDLHITWGCRQPLGKSRIGPPVVRQGAGNTPAACRRFGQSAVCEYFGATIHQTRYGLLGAGAIYPRQ